MVPLKFPFIQRSVIFVNDLTFKPTVTSLHQKEPTNPEPPGGSPIRMHVVNKKQIYTPKKGPADRVKRLCWSVLMFIMGGRLDDVNDLNTFTIFPIKHNR